MGNTVGSQRKLTRIQKEALIGMILGDGTLEMNGHYPRLRVEHGLKQKEYLKWKYKMLAPLTVRKIQCFERKYPYCKFDTISTPLLEPYYKLFYRRGKKCIPEEIVQLLRSPLSLAIWFMDDGYRRNDCNALRISTDAFSLREQKLLIKALKKNFGIKARIHKKGRTWNIYIPSCETRKFSSLIKEYVIEEMKYKLPLTP